MNNPDREYDEMIEAAIIEEMNEHDARTERMMERADRIRTERKDREWEKACEAVRSTPETDAEFADAVEETNAPSAKLIYRLQRERDEAREVANTLSAECRKAQADAIFYKQQWDRLARIELAARALVKAKGRHHSKIAYECLVDALEGGRP